MFSGGARRARSAGRRGVLYKTHVGPTTGTNAFSAALNWSPPGVPVSGDDVCVTADGTYTVAIGPEGASVNSVTIGGSSGTATLSVTAGPAGPAGLTYAAASSTTAHGELALDSTDGHLTGVSSSAVFTNNGTLSLLKGAGGTRYVQVIVDNTASGTVTVTSDDVRVNANTAVTNAGTWTVASGGQVVMSNGSSFTNTGLLTNNGTFVQQGGTFTQSAGSESGNAVVVSSATLADSAGSGTFQLVGFDNTLTGTIPAGQTVTVLGTPSAPSTTHFASATVVNNGTLALDSSNGQFALVDAGSLTNNGTLNVNQGAGGTRYLRVPVTNASTGTVNVTAADMRQDAGTTDTNNGSWLLGDGARQLLAGGSSLVTGATGTLGFTVNVATPGVSQITGGAVTLGGRLLVNTIGTPPLGTVYTPVSGAAVSGSFASFEYGPNDYTVGTTASTMSITAVAPFTMVTKPAKFVRMKQKQVALATVKDPVRAAAYSVTIDWGDGHQATGTFKTNRKGGIAKGTHTYTAAGTYTVATTVHASDGTTITMTNTATVR